MASRGNYQHITEGSALQGTESHEFYGVPWVFVATRATAILGFGLLISVGACITSGTTHLHDPYAVKFTALRVDILYGTLLNLAAFLFFLYIIGDLGKGFGFEKKWQGLKEKGICERIVRCFFGCYMCLPALAVPLAVLFAESWWAEVSRSFSWCIHQCYESSDTGYVAACSRFGLHLTVENAKRQRTEALAWGHVICPTCSETTTMQTFEQMYDDTKQCIHGFGNASRVSNYYIRLVKERALFRAFESQSRRYFRVSTAEIYGPFWLLLSLTFMTVIHKAFVFKRDPIVAHSRMFLWSKVLHRNEAKLERITTYSETFEHLHELWMELQGGSETAQEWWFVKALRESKEHVQMHRVDLEAPSTDDALNQELDPLYKKLVECTVQEHFFREWPTIQTILVASVLAMLHTSIPIIMRWLDFKDIHRAFVPVTHLQTLQWISYVASTLIRMYIWICLINALTEYEATVSVLHAFNLLWHFPEDQEIRELRLDVDRVRAVRCQRWSSTTYLGMSRQLNTNADPQPEDEDFQDLHSLVQHKLLVWFDIRRFLQIFSTLPRLKLEMTSIIGILLMAPSAVMGVLNCTVFRDRDRDPIPNNTSSLVGLYDFLSGAIFLWQALTQTVSLDNRYRYHERQLKALKSHLNLEFARSAACSSTHDTTQQMGGRRNELQKDLDLIESMEAIIKDFDTHMTFFGFTVDNTFMGRMQTLATGLFVYQLFPLSLSFLKTFQG